MAHLLCTTILTCVLFAVTLADHHPANIDDIVKQQAELTKDMYDIIEDKLSEQTMLLEEKIAVLEARVAQVESRPVPTAPNLEPEQPEESAKRIEERLTTPKAAITMTEEEPVTIKAQPSTTMKVTTMKATTRSTTMSPTTTTATTISPTTTMKATTAATTQAATTKAITMKTTQATTTTKATTTQATTISPTTTMKTTTAATTQTATTTEATTTSPTTTMKTTTAETTETATTTAPATTMKTTTATTTLAATTTQATTAKTTTTQAPMTTASSMYPVSCAEIYKDGYRSSGEYPIDPDGLGPLAPFTTYCDMETGEGVTMIGHENEEENIDVNGFDKPGSFVLEMVYNNDITIQQIGALVDASKECRQFVKYACKSSSLMAIDERFGLTYAWWVDRNGDKRVNWAGAPTDSMKCACGVSSDGCFRESTTCNCDHRKAKNQIDEGYFDDKDVLPIMSIHLGDTGSKKERGALTVGKLICRG